MRDKTSHCQMTNEVEYVLYKALIQSTLQSRYINRPFKTSSRPALLYYQTTRHPPHPPQTSLKPPASS